MEPETNHFGPRRPARTPWICGECRVQVAVAADSFFWCLRIAWGLQCFRRAVQNDAATIAFGVRPKMEVGLRMRASVISSVTGHGAK